MPTAVVMAVQPLQKAYDFEGFQAPIIQVEELCANAPGTVDQESGSTTGQGISFQ